MDLHRRKLVLGIVLVVFFFITLGIGSFFRFQSSPRTSSTTPSQSPSPTVVASLQLESGKEILEVGNTTDVGVVGKSDKSITGYDAVIIYDPSQVEFVDASSSSNSFDFYKEQKDGRLILTGIQKLSIATPTLLHDQVVAHVRFKIKKVGTSFLSLEYIPGSKKDSNLIDTQSHDVLTSVKGTQIQAGNLLKLQEKEPIVQDNVEYELQSIILPDLQCRDCITSVTLFAKKGTETIQLDFKTGGIAGIMEVEKEAFSHRIMLKDIQTNLAEFIISPL
ncbi:MAG: cohesin domain-containing protein [bacterium]|nr:cohesin domain-containing protein [bacterium]